MYLDLDSALTYSTYICLRTPSYMYSSSTYILPSVSASHLVSGGGGGLGAPSLALVMFFLFHLNIMYIAGADCT